MSVPDRKWFITRMYEQKTKEIEQFESMNGKNK